MRKEDKETLVELLEEYAYEQNDPETTLTIIGLIDEIRES
jgi:hypothetical protein